MATGSVGCGTCSGKTTSGAAGWRDVMIIVSEGDSDLSGVVRRRSAIQLTEELRGKLENQGILKHQQLDDLSIVKARYGLDKYCTVSELSRGRETRQTILENIVEKFRNSKSEGVVLYYIGDGRRNTGDWCFQDGFITFADLAKLYVQHLRGRVLTIVSDCSHSGSWLQDCMTFLDQQGVGPCGHKARDKGILLKVLTSCLSHEIPRRLAYAVFGCQNDKNTGEVSFTGAYDFISPQSKLGDDQHRGAKDFTEIRCGQEDITGPCRCLQQATWKKWSARKRTFTFKGKDSDTKAWHIVLLEDSDLTVLEYLEATTGYTDCTHYGQVLKSGWGEDPTKEEVEAALQNYAVYSVYLD